MNTKLHLLPAFLFSMALTCGLVTSLAMAQDDEPTQSEIETGRPDPLNATPGKLTVQLSGTGTANSDTQLQMVPSSFDTGLIEIGGFKNQSFKIKHGGSAGAKAVQINEAEIFGTHPDEYTVDFNGFQTLYPGDEIDVNVTFTPTTPGQKSAGLRLSVEGLTAPVVFMFKGESRYPFTSDLGASVDTVDFGQSPEGQAATKTFTLTNLGETSAPAVNITSFNITGQNADQFTSNFTQTVIQPGQSTDITVTLKATAIGFNQAEATITHDGNNDEIVMNLQGTKVEVGNLPIGFSTSVLKGANVTRGTAAQFGPDGKLYVTEMNGLIKIYDVVRNGKNNYNATLDDTINSVAQTPNHNDDGSPANLGNKRLVTGLYVTGTAAQPVIYLASSDPRQAAGPSGLDSGLDTNSGILHRLTKSGNNWTKKDLVRGLPRSEENHVSNGIAMQGNTLYLIVGGHTNEGAPSNNFAMLPEYALSAAVLEIDLNAIGNTTYDLPTLDDEDRTGVNDANDPFGGNDGKNQAKLMPNSPVKIYATGYRNGYDLVITEAGKMYTFDNGPNAPWGGPPIGNCTNNVSEGGVTKFDQLHVINKNSYGGHPNPTRGNKGNTFNNSNPQTPIEGAERPADCVYKPGGDGDGSLTIINGSTNGLTEYTASNFGGQMKGDLVVSSFSKKIIRVELTGNGNGVAGKQVLLNNFGTAPLDITAQGDAGPFPGTMWIIDNFKTDIMVMEPDDY